MTEISNKEEFMNYTFEQHKGYGTKKHLEEINNFGVCSLHRKTFAPIKNMFDKSIDN